MEDELVRLLSELYMKQHIREPGSPGVLASDFAGRMESISGLMNRGYVTQGRFYKFETLRCSDVGEEIARENIAKTIRDRRPAIKGIMNEIPPRVLRFLIGDCVKNALTWPIMKSRYMFFDWRQLPLDDDRIWTQSLKLFSSLEKNSLCFRTSSYVSTRGGELREEEFVLSPEINTFLHDVSSISSGLTLEESQPFRLAQFLLDVAPYLTPGGTSDQREFVWRKLDAYSLADAELELALKDISKHNLTSEWYGLLSPKQPFEVRDPVALKIYLNSSLIKPAVENLIVREEEVVDIDVIMTGKPHSVREGLATSLEAVVPKPTLPEETQMPSVAEVSSFKTRGELYEEIAML